MAVGGVIVAAEAMVRAIGRKKQHTTWTVKDVVQSMIQAVISQQTDINIAYVCQLCVSRSLQGCPFFCLENGHCAARIAHFSKRLAPIRREQRVILYRGATKKVTFPDMTRK